MKESEKIIGNIYDPGTAASYYDVVGKDVGSNEKTEGDKLLESMIPQSLEGKVVLDLGSGNGRYSELLAQRGASKVLAIDLSQAMIERAKERRDADQLDRINIIRADMDHLPLSPGKIDYIFSRFALMYTGRLNDLVKNLSTSLNKDGEALLEVNTVNISDQSVEIDIKKESLPLIISSGDKKVNIKNFAHSLQDYLEVFAEAGLKVLDVKQFPADELSVDPSCEYAKYLTFNYVIFRLKKEGEK